MTTPAVDLDAYDVLEVSPSADAKALRGAYRARARLLHPDVNTDPDGLFRFAELSDAYELLSDPVRRAELDERRRVRAAFVERRPAPRAHAREGRDAHRVVRVDPHLASRGGVHDVPVEVLVACTVCDGLGTVDPGALEECEACEATGHVAHRQHTGSDDVLTWRPCRRCGASGTVLRDPCSPCHGTGRREGTRVIRVAFPPGLVTGSRLLVLGAGDAGVCAGVAGDLVLEADVRASPASEQAAESSGGPIDTGRDDSAGGTDGAAVPEATVETGVDEIEEVVRPHLASVAGRMPTLTMALLGTLDGRRLCSLPLRVGDDDLAETQGRAARLAAAYAAAAALVAPERDPDDGTVDPTGADLRLMSLQHGSEQGVLVRIDAAAVGSVLLCLSAEDVPMGVVFALARTTAESVRAALVQWGGVVPGNPVEHPA